MDWTLTGHCDLHGGLPGRGSVHGQGEVLCWGVGEVHNIVFAHTCTLHTHTDHVCMSVRAVRVQAACGW